MVALYLCFFLFLIVIFFLQIMMINTTIKQMIMTILNFEPCFFIQERGNILLGKKKYSVILFLFTWFKSVQVARSRKLMLTLKNIITLLPADVICLYRVRARMKKWYKDARNLSIPFHLLYSHVSFSTFSFSSFLLFIPLLLPLPLLWLPFSSLFAYFLVLLFIPLFPPPLHFLHSSSSSSLFPTLSSSSSSSFLFT